MASLQVKDLPEELHRELRARARAEGMTLADYVLHVLRRDLAIPSPRAWAARVGSREPVEGADITAVIAEAHDDRAAELARAGRR